MTKTYTVIVDACADGDNHHKETYLVPTLEAAQEKVRDLFFNRFVDWINSYNEDWSTDYDVDKQDQLSFDIWLEEDSFIGVTVKTVENN